MLWHAREWSFHWRDQISTLPTVKSKILIAAFVLDAVCAIAAPFAIGLFPTKADAAEDDNQFLVFSDGHCYELSQLGEAHWRIEGEADVAACKSTQGD